MSELRSFEQWMADEADDEESLDLIAAELSRAAAKNAKAAAEAARDRELQAMRERVEKRMAENKARFDEIIAAAPPGSEECPKHPGNKRPIDRDKTYVKMVLSYGACDECQREEKLQQQNRRLHAGGVPSNLLHATLDNWLPRDPTEESHLASLREFSKRQRGFLLMLGALGTGKTHLAVGSMRYFDRPVLFKQNSLLRALRATYHDRNAENPIPLCQDASLLVLDELGVSSGGRDEYPALHEILDHRFGEFLPTIITSNLGTQELRDMLGERLMDRIAQAAFKVLTFGGPSHRRQLREQYQAGERQADPDDSWKDSL